MPHACNLSTQQTEARGSQFKAAWDIHRDPVSKNKNTKVNMIALMRNLKTTCICWYLIHVYCGVFLHLFVMIYNLLCSFIHLFIPIYIPS